MSDTTQYIVTADMQNVIVFCVLALCGLAPAAFVIGGMVKEYRESGRR